MKAQAANTAKIIATVIAAVGLFFGGNLLSRCEGLSTDAEAAEAHGIMNERMDRIEAALEKVVVVSAKNATQVEILLDRDSR